MNTDLIFKKLEEITGESEPVCVTIQTQEDCFVYANDKMKEIESKEKQSICFCLIHTIINTFADYERIN